MNELMKDSLKIEHVSMMLCKLKECNVTGEQTMYITEGQAVSLYDDFVEHGLFDQVPGIDDKIEKIDGSVILGVRLEVDRIAPWEIVFSKIEAAQHGGN